MRILTNKETGELIEAQSDATEGTLIANAVAAGMSASDVVESVVSDEEYAALRKSMEPKPVISVSPWQIRKALTVTNLRDSVEAAVAASDQNTRDAWQYATAFVRDDPLVIAMRESLGKTVEEIDALFELAASL